MPRPPRAVLFDLGGVVLDVDFERVLGAWARASGNAIAALRERFQVDEGYRRHERGEIGIDDYWSHCRAALGLAIGRDDFVSGWNEIFGGVIDGMPDLVRAARCCARVGCLSNTNAAHQREFTRLYGATMALFERACLSHEIGARKPEAAAYLAACRGLGAAPADTLFLDDNDDCVAGALAAGLSAVRVRSAAEAAAALRAHRVI